MKKLIAMLLALSMIFAFASVASAESVSVEEWCPKGSKIGFSTITLGAEFFAALDDLCKQYFEEAGYEYICTSFEGNAATQVTDIENMINMGCDAILMFVSDEAAITDVCKRAIAEGIKVYPIATWVSDRDAYTFCQGTDQYKTGVGAAEMAAAWIEETFPDAADGSIEVVVIGNTQTAESSDRTNGFYQIEEMTAKAKVVEMFDVSGATNSNIKSQEYTDIIVSKYPDCKVILCYGVDVELGVNEVIMRTPGIDYAHFAAFGVDTSMVAYLFSSSSPVKRNMRTMWKKTPNSRIELPDYCERSVFEALVNALIHRDYLIYGSEVHIDIFDDRMTIYSPGGMPDGTQIQNLDINDIPSTRRNPVLADVFNRLGYMERQGSGLGKILDACANAHNYAPGMEPTFFSNRAQFTVTLKNLNIGVGIGDIDDPNDDPNNDANTDPDARQLVILEAIRSNNKVTYVQLAGILGVSRKTAQRRSRPWQMRRKSNALAAPAATGRSTNNSHIETRTPGRGRIILPCSGVHLFLQVRLFGKSLQCGS